MTHALRRARIFGWGGHVAAHVGTARGSFLERRGLLVALEDEDGRLGLGEAAPLPGLSHASLSDTRAELEGFGWGSTTLPDAATALGRSALLRGAAAQQSVDFALADLAAQRDGRPLAAWLAGGLALPASLPTSIYVGSTGDPETFARVEAALARGATALKLKRADEPIERSLSACARVRALVGARVGLRLDCNGNGSPALGSLLAPLQLELIEEPVAGEALLSLRPAATPVFADESLAVPQRAHALLAHPAIAGVVLKPMLLGLPQTLALAEEAARQGKRALVTHAFEGPVGLAGTCALALALAARLPGTMLAPGLDYHAAVESFEAADVPLLPRGAVHVTPCARAGLGVELQLDQHEELFRWTR